MYDELDRAAGSITLFNQCVLYQSELLRKQFSQSFKLIVNHIKLLVQFGR